MTRKTCLRDNCALDGKKVLSGYLVDALCLFVRRSAEKSFTGCTRPYRTRIVLSCMGAQGTPILPWKWRPREPFPPPSQSWSSGVHKWHLAGDSPVSTPKVFLWPLVDPPSRHMLVELRIGHTSSYSLFY